MGKTTDMFLWLKIRLSTTNRPYHYKPKVLLQVEQTTLKLLMLVSDFKVNYKLQNTQRNFQWNPWNAGPLTRMRRKKDDTLPYNKLVTRFSLLTPNRLISSSEVYRPGGDLVETNQ